MKTIKNAPPRPTLRGLVLALAVTVLSSYVVTATPYATELKLVGGTVSFTLNEAADTVKISFGATTTNLGPLAAGSYSTNVSATSPFSIEVTKSSAPGYKIQTSPLVAGKIQISTDPSTAKFPTPRGLAVNKNPASQFFGRVYVDNSTPGSYASPARIVGRGLYTLKADLTDSPNGYGTNVQTGGLLFAGSPGGPAANANSPYRLSVGQDDHVYIADYSDANGNVYRVDGNLLNGEWVFDYRGGPGTISSPTNHGSVLKVIAEGSLATSDLKVYTIDEDYGAVYNNKLWRYDINGGPLTNQSLPTVLSGALISGFSVNDDFCKGGPNNYFYLMQNRSIPASVPALYVVDASGTTITNSQNLWRAITGNPTDLDVLTNLQSIAISPDGKFLACAMQGNLEGFKTYIIPLDANGIPDLANRALLTSGTVVQGRAVDFDAAGNLYTASSGDAMVRSFSPGGYTVATTSSSGTFSVDSTIPSTTVSVVATTPNASQGNPTPVPGVFTITRTGGITTPLYVNFSLSGTASNSTYTVTGAGAQYTNITFAIGQSTTNVTITPVNDGIARRTTTVGLALNTGTNYIALPPSAATITIQNTAEPLLFISAAATTAYKRYTNDYVSVSITRLGRTNDTVTLSTFSYGGSAVQNTDYAAIPFTLNPGVITATAKLLCPLNPPEPIWVGNKTVTVTLTNNGSTYTVAPAANTATFTILDDKYPAASVLWSDPLTNNIDANNDDLYGQWNITAVNRDGTDPFAGYDMTINWGYDLTADPTGGVGTPLPPTGFPYALRATYNKVHGVGGAVNLYPTNVTFSGDYAVRFNMYLSQGSAIGKLTEGVLFGINHDGLQTNWFGGSAPIVGGPWTSDGVWYWIDADAGGAAAGDYRTFTGNANAIPNTGWATPNPALFGSTSFANVFKDPETFSLIGATTNFISGLPVNASPLIIPTTNANWADVEIKQVKNVVTLSINKTVIFTYANTNSLFQQGTLMLGYEDAFDSLSTPEAVAYFSNLQVVRLGVPTITHIALSAPNVVIQFTGGDGNFALQSCATANGTYADVSPAATFTQNPVTEVFQTVYPQNGTARYYRIRYQP